MAEMKCDPATGPPTASLRATQLARKKRIVAAATDFALRGGDDTVQMRDVAARANVANTYAPAANTRSKASCGERVRPTSVGVRDAVLVPVPDDTLVLTPASSLVNSVNNDGPELLLANTIPVQWSSF